MTVKSGAGKGGKGHLKKAQESSSTDDKCVSSESLSLSSRSQEERGEEERRNMQRKADSNGSPSDDAMLTGGSDSPSISTSEGKGSTPHQESLLG